jgi:hypothetical protein
MSILRQNYTSNIPITITLASLANGATALSTANDNSGFLFFSADIQIRFMTGVSPTNNGILRIYLIKSVDGGVVYDDSDASTAEFLRSIEVTNVASTTYITTIFAETLPKFWKIMVRNNTGSALDSTAGNFSVIYEGKRIEVI